MYALRGGAHTSIVRASNTLMYFCAISKCVFFLFLPLSTQPSLYSFISSQRRLQFSRHSFIGLRTLAENEIYRSVATVSRCNKMNFVAQRTVQGRSRDDSWKEVKEEEYERSQDDDGKEQRAARSRQLSFTAQKCTGGIESHHPFVETQKFESFADVLPQRFNRITVRSTSALYRSSLSGYAN